MLKELIEHIDPVCPWPLIGALTFRCGNTIYTALLTILHFLIFSGWKLWVHWCRVCTPTNSPLHSAVPFKRSCPAAKEKNRKAATHHWTNIHSSCRKENGCTGSAGGSRTSPLEKAEIEKEKGLWEKAYYFNGTFSKWVKKKLGNN